MKLDVKVKRAVVGAVCWRMMKRHDVRKWHAPQVVVTDEHHLQGFCEVFQFSLVHRRKPGVRLLRRDVAFVRIPCEVWNEGNCRRVFVNDSSSVFAFGPDDLLKKNASCFCVMLAADGRFSLDS